MLGRNVEPDAQGDVWLSVLQAAWLLRTSEETIRRWIRANEVSLKPDAPDTCVLWRSLDERALRLGQNPPAHWAWLAADLQDPPPSLHDLAGLYDVQSLQQRLIDAESARDIAQAEAENLDQAVMAYRDSWRRRTQPQSAGHPPR